MLYRLIYPRGQVILRPVSLAIAIAFSILFARIAAGQANATNDTNATLPGVQKHVPETGWYVKTDRGVMVPYQVSFHDSQVKFVMQPIPGGRFIFEIPQVGSESDENIRGKIEPRRIAVDVEPFWMAVHEVTWGEYREFQKLEVRFKEHQTRKLKLVEEKDEFDIVTAPSAVYDAHTIEQAGKEEDQPAVCMTQYSAKQYTKFLSLSTGSFYRLPSAAQWQYACLAGREPEELLEGVAMLDLSAWSKRNAKQRRHRVGGLKPNPWGIFDMQGNVSEWVLDDARFEGKKWQEMSLTDDQAISWPDSGWGRLVCGGDFTVDPKNCMHNSWKASHENWNEDDPELPQSPFWLQSDNSTGVGFRIIRPLTEPATREEREKFWKADCDWLVEAIKSHVDENWRGAKGKVALSGELKND